MPFTKEELAARRLRRKADRAVAKNLAEIEAVRNQPEVERLSIAIEWKRSRMWGNNPHATCKVHFKNGRFARTEHTCGGCGYDKESTVIAEAFNMHLRYLLLDREHIKKPYGVRGWDQYTPREFEALDPKPVLKIMPRFEGGVGTSCYTDGHCENGIGQFIGGSFRCIASGKTFDAYEWKAEK